MMNEAKIIPPVKELEYFDGTGKECIFIMDENLFNSHSSYNSKILDHVSGFFKYYQKFNFSDLVICPRDGSYEDRDFSLKESFKSFPFDSAINLQDPFEMHRNLTDQMTTSAIQR